MISIIMPVHNGECTIRKSIDSILNQSFQDIKIYIVDDCSDDDTPSIISGYNSDRIFYLRNKENLGVAESRNVGINFSKGKYISFLDSDDIWHPEKLKKQIDILNSGFDVVCSNYIAFQSENNLMEGRKRMSPEVIFFKDMLKSNFIGNLTGIYNAEKLGKFYQKNIGHEDYVMWLGIMTRAQKAYCVQEPLAYYRVSSTSLSGNKFKAMLWQWNIYRNEVKLSLVSSCYFFFCYVFYALKKRKN
ncbi:glycosyltransferase family 2 protein [Pectobacterium versatile]|uniref:glycosyltransferase family 2 protein n=1 Tax=Pectobacterium versatile TaxID=2488639 RepID=UPI003864F935